MQTFCRPHDLETTRFSEEDFISAEISRMNELDTVPPLNSTQTNSFNGSVSAVRRPLKRRIVDQHRAAALITLKKVFSSTGSALNYPPVQ